MKRSHFTIIAKAAAVIAILALIALTVLPAFAATTPTRFEVSGWIPYWRSLSGSYDAITNMKKLAEVNPFGYTIKTNGGLKDNFNVNSQAATTLLRKANASGVRVVPSVTTSDGASVYALLSNTQSRTAHIAAITDAVNTNAFGGIDIDYEGKLAKTKPYFSAFLTELKKALGTKELSCTIEARTPPDSLYTVIPKTLEYVNDYSVINKNCDQVRIMTYDQQRADIKLDASHTGPYMPIADTAWVEKVVTLTTKTISPSKLVLGVATYGAEWTVSASPSGHLTYKKVRSYTADEAKAFAGTLKIQPFRNDAGELDFTYLPSTTSADLANTIKSTSVPSSVNSADKIGAQAIAYAKSSGTTVTFRLVWWSDASSVADKIALAKAHGLRGVAIFKLDGTEDKNFWSVLR